MSKKISVFLLGFWIFIFGRLEAYPDFIYADSPSAQAALREEFSVEDIEIIENLELLESLEFLEVDVAFLDNYEILDELLEESQTIPATEDKTEDTNEK